MENALTLRKAVMLLGIDCDTNRSSVNIQCPVCGKGRERKMNLNFDKYGPDKGVFRCPKCNSQGGDLQFWALMRGLNTTDLTAVSRDYFQFIGQDNNKEKIINVKRKPYVRKDVDIASVDIRNKTYTALLDLLNLSPNHKKDLIKRGLDEKTIEKNGYKSYPTTSTNQICEYLLSKGYILEGVPGFYKDNGKWVMVRFGNYTGYLIPQRDGYNRIQGLQIRFDTTKKNQRYLTLSSSERQNGSKGRANVHFARGNRSIKNIILTEGPLKADIISYFTGYSVLAIQGVNATSLLEYALYDLKRVGVAKISIALDMDMYTNKYVQEALKKLNTIISEMNIDYEVLTWEQTEKGLDDWLLANQSLLNRG